MAELGYITLGLALFAALLSVASFVFGGRERTSWFNRNGRKLVIAVFMLVSAAVVILATAILTHHFEIWYVYQYTSKDMPLLYLITAFWAGGAGSLLLWSWFISICACILVIRQRPGKRELIPYALAVVMAVQAFFLVLILFSSNPFTRLGYMPSDGMGLNPLFENPGMLFYAPALLAGWAVITVPFAFAISALLNNKLDNTWISSARRWAVMAWLLLGAGNLASVWLAYAVYDWGRYWTWSPVENAGLIPWLLATAFIHSLILQKRRGGFKLWNLVLIVLVFVSTVFGLLLTGGDILSGINSFGLSDAAGLVLGLLAVSLFGSIGLVIWRRKTLGAEIQIENFISREATFLLLNLLFVGLALVILLATLATIMFEQFVHNQSFYDRAVVPLLVFIFLLIGLCVTIGWRRPEARKLRFTLVSSSLVALVVVIATAIAGYREWFALVLTFVAVLVIIANIIVLTGDVRSRKRALSENYPVALVNLVRSNRERYGGYLVHIAISIMFVSAVISAVYSVEENVVLAPGETATIKNYDITYQTLLSSDDGSRIEISAVLDVYKGDRPLGEMQPSIIYHRSYEEIVSRQAIHHSIIEDISINLTGWDQDSHHAGLMAEVNPMVSWIWLSGGFFLVGGLICYWPKGRKQALSSGDSQLS